MEIDLVLVLVWSIERTLKYKSLNISAIIVTEHKKKKNENRIDCDKFLANAAALSRFDLMILEIFSSLSAFVILLNDDSQHLKLACFNYRIGGFF